MVWITRLTLMAYLVGGWLLPASHFHAHQSAACGGHVHESPQVGCGHSHDHCHPHAQTRSKAAGESSRVQSDGCDRNHLSEGGLVGQRAHSSHCHDGLCAVAPQER